MINIPMKTESAFDCNSITSINNRKVQPSGVHNHITDNRQTNVQQTDNRQTGNSQTNSRQTDNRQTGNPQQTIPAENRPIPVLKKPVQKGQKVPVKPAADIHTLKACFGWNTTNSKCDVDVSAFLLGADGKVPGDSWFVFYGQTLSPDQSTELMAGNSTDREIIKINFKKLHPDVKKIVFVLTINEAFENHLNFGMMKDAYVRILDENTNQELVSFKMTDYYSNVISMMIGEIYHHNDTWKFNAVGNGVARDLAGLCELYGVQVID